MFGRVYGSVLLLLMCLGMFLLPAPAGAGRSVQLVGSPDEVCSLRAYVVDPDPQGLNVRSGPGKQFPVVGKIPRGDGAVGVNVVGSVGQWLQVEDARIQGEEEVLFKGPGWVYGPMLATETRSEGYDGPKPVVKVYREPSARSAVAGKLPPGLEVRITGCKAHWARIQSKGLTGWIDGESQCANTLTNCS